MRFYSRVAASAALASGVIVLGTSCRPERLTSPAEDLAVATPLRPSTSRVVSIASHPDTLQLGQSAQLAAKLTGASLHTQGLTWSSLDSSVVVVNASGVATGVGGGTGRVVASSSGLADTTMLIVVASVAAVVASPDSGSVTVGQTSQLSAVAQDALGHALPAAPIVWSSTDSTIARVSASGVVSGVAAGTSKVIASAEGKADTVAVLVTVVPVASVGVAPSTVSVSVGATAQLTASALAADGSTLSNRLVTWASSNAAAATVSATGLVSAVAAGSATITATVDGKSAPVTVTVQSAAVSSVSVALNATALTLGQTTQATATLRDGAGTALTGRAVTWTSSKASVATVSSSGLVTSVGAGTADITATSEGKSGSATVTVTIPVVATVSVAVNSSSISVGQTTQATATAKDSKGVVITGRPVTWASSNPLVASVSTGGLVSGVSAGTMTVSATVDGVTASTAVAVTSQVTTPTPSTGPGALPELPRYSVDYHGSAMPSNGATIRVPAGGNLQDAIDQARPGDVILLAPGATYTGNFLLRAKAGASGSAWITIRTETTLPAEGTRVTPSAASSYAKVVTPGVAPVFQTDAGASYYRLSGLEITAAPTLTMVYSLVSLGDSRLVQRTIASVPHHIVLDRDYIHGWSKLDLRRCVAANASWMAVVDSWLSDCHSMNGDSQAIWGANAPGPYTIVNNRLEGAGENIMFGGADSYSPELMPTDITIQRNHVIKPASWQGVWYVKNLFELKAGKRVLVEQNAFEGSWYGGQTGTALLFKSVNQEGTAPWSETSDVTVRWNRVDRSAAGWNFAGAPELGPVNTPAHTILVEQNYVAPLGDPALGPGLQVATDGLNGLVFRHNSMSGTAAAVYFTAGQQTGFVFNDNVATGGNYQWGFASANGHGAGVMALDYHAPGWVARGNCLASTGEGGVLNNTYTADIASAGFVNASTGDFRLTASSPCKGKATDGTDPGVDMAQLNAKLQGVVILQ